jgi:hypothetical protein
MEKGQWSDQPARSGKDNKFRNTTFVKDKDNLIDNGSK